MCVYMRLGFLSTRAYFEKIRDMEENSEKLKHNYGQNCRITLATHQNSKPETKRLCLLL